MSGSDPDSISTLAAAIGGLLLTCSALRAGHNRRIRGLEEEIARLTIAADRDHLTGLGNRRSFESRLASEWRRALRHGSHFTLALIDVDHFKLFNDAYGHPAGDLALRAVAGCLAGVLERPADGAFRVGGEEFALILPDTDECGAGVIGGRVRRALQAAALPHGSSQSGFVTASIGSCSTIARDGEQPGHLLTLADQALYDAKRAGRDRAVCVRSRSPSVRRPDPQDGRGTSAEPDWFGSQITPTPGHR